MKEYSYYIIDPTKNITAVVIDDGRINDRAGIAAQIMEKEPTVEQVGFLSINDNVHRLDMAGGEFCGNAAMSSAALICSLSGAASGETREVVLSVSGAKEPIKVKVTSEDPQTFFCAVMMPGAEKIVSTGLSVDGKDHAFPVVYLSGIAHVIVSNDEIDETEAEKSIKEWCRLLGVQCLGIMLLDRSSMALKPLVYVPEADTLFWESSCASGTAAVGEYMYHKTGERQDLTLSEPGGKLRIKADAGGLTLEGSAVIKRKGHITDGIV